MASLLHYGLELAQAFNFDGLCDNNTKLIVNNFNNPFISNSLKFFLFKDQEFNPVLIHFPTICLSFQKLERDHKVTLLVCVFRTGPPDSHKHLRLVQVHFGRDVDKCQRNGELFYQPNRKLIPIQLRIHP